MENIEKQKTEAVPENAVTVEGTAESEAPAAESSSESTFYTFKDYMGLQVFDAEVKAETQPENSTTYKPPQLTDDLNKIYWDGHGWLEGRDLAKADIDALKADAQIKAARDFSKAVDKIIGDYPGTESRMWTKMAVDARAFKVSGPTPFLNAMAAAKSANVSDVVASILEKADAYDTAYGTALGTYQKVRAEIDTRTKLSQFDVTGPHFLWIGGPNAS